MPLKKISTQRTAVGQCNDKTTEIVIILHVFLYISTLYLLHACCGKTAENKNIIYKILCEHNSYKLKSKILNWGLNFCFSQQQQQNRELRLELSAFIYFSYAIYLL